MNIMRAAAAPPYSAPGHDRMQMRRLQGREAGTSDTAWLGLSVIEPGGGTTSSAASVEKFYVVLEGVIEVESIGAKGTHVTELGPLDSVRFEPHEARRLTNRSTRSCTLLLVMPNSP